LCRLFAFWRADGFLRRAYPYPDYIRILPRRIRVYLQQNICNQLFWLRSSRKTWEGSKTLVWNCWTNVGLKLTRRVEKSYCVTTIRKTVIFAGWYLESMSEKPRKHEKDRSTRIEKKRKRSRNRSRSNPTLCTSGICRGFLKIETNFCCTRW
jgi:hypothetical protein